MPILKARRSNLKRFILRNKAFLNILALCDHFVGYKSQKLRIKTFANSTLYLSKGFTLIELLVVLAVVGILTTILLANYNNFGRRQAVKNAAAALKTELRKYQTFAISGQKNPTQLPIGSGCNDDAHTMDFYFVIISPSAPQVYDARLRCDAGAIVVPVADSLPWSSDTTVSEVGTYDGTTFTSCSDVDIEFHPLGRGVNLECPDGTPVPAGQSVYIRLTNESAAYNVFVTDSGRIYDEKAP